MQEVERPRPSCSVYSGVGVTASSVYCFDRDLNLFVQSFACFITSKLHRLAPSCNTL